MDYGRNIIGNTGIPIQVSADGRPEWVPVGITIDWSTVAAVGSDTTIPIEGVTVKNGQKYLRYGQVLARITAQPVQTATIGGSPTGGTFTLSGVRPDTGVPVTTAAIAYNASAAAVLAALQDPAVFGTAVPITVSGTGPYVITAPVALLTASGAGLTGGTSPSASVALTTAVANAGMFGPYDFAATDGRQTVANGSVCILNETVLELGLLGMGLAAYPSSHPGALVGGLVWKPRLLATAGTHSLAAGPTYTELAAALPRLAYAGVTP